MRASLAILRQRWRNPERQRIYIVPTRAGYGYAGLLLLMLLGAINYNNSLGHMLSFLLAGLGHVAMHYSHRNLNRLKLNISPGEPVFCGQPARFGLSLFKADNRPAFDLEIAVNQYPHGRRFQFLRGFEPLHTIEVVQQDNSSQCLLPVMTRRRGWLKLNPVRIASRFPLGLFFTWTVHRQAITTLVYPRPSGELPLPLQPDSDRQQRAQEQAGDDDFAGLNNYRHGEPLHRVAWKALARDEVMRSKQFSSPRGQTLMLCWQDVNSLPDIESRLSQLCQWVLQADNAGMSYGLQLPAQRIEPGRGQAHRHNCLKALALYG